MITFFSDRLAGRKPRRAIRSSALGSSPEYYEERTLLSGVAIYPQPAAVVVQSDDAGTAAAPPGNFAGTWNITTSEGAGTANITQDDNQLQISLNFGGFILPANGKVKGDTASAKIKTSFMGVNVRGKVVTSLTGANSMAGDATVKVPGLGKLSIPLTGVRI